MGRLSALHKKLITPPSDYYLNKKKVQECLSVLSKLTESVLKSRGKRRERFLEDLSVAHQNLAVCFLQKETLEKREERLEDRIEKLENKTQKKQEPSYLAPSK